MSYSILEKNHVGSTVVAEWFAFLNEQKRAPNESLLDLQARLLIEYVTEDGEDNLMAGKLLRISGSDRAIRVRMCRYRGALDTGAWPARRKVGV